MKYVVLGFGNETYLIGKSLVAMSGSEVYDVIVVGAGVEGAPQLTTSLPGEGRRSSCWNRYNNICDGVVQHVMAQSRVYRVTGYAVFIMY